MGKAPSSDLWLKEAKMSPDGSKCGMFLIHNGTVRLTARDAVRNGKTDTRPVTGMMFDYDETLLAEAVSRTEKMPGIFYVRVWLNRGRLSVGDDMMLVLVGGDIRPRVVEALDILVGTLKEKCVIEKEIFS